jgi:hypothetical protein
MYREKLNEGFELVVKLTCCSVRELPTVDFLFDASAYRAGH